MVVDLSFFRPCFIRKFFSLCRMSSIRFDMWVNQWLMHHFFGGAYVKLIVYQLLITMFTQFVLLSSFEGVPQT